MLVKVEKRIKNNHIESSNKRVINMNGLMCGLRNTVTVFGCLEVDKNENILVCRHAYIVMMRSINKCNHSLSNDIHLAKN